MSRFMNSVLTSSMTDFMATHRYSAYTGLSSMYNDQAVQCTWEGDNSQFRFSSSLNLLANLLSHSHPLPPIRSISHRLVRRSARR